MAPVKRNSVKAKLTRVEKKQIRKAKNSNPSLQVEGLHLSMKVFLLVVVAVLIYDKIGQSINSPISKQLQKYSEIFQREVNLTEQIISPLEVDPMLNIIKIHLNPIKDRISSIRTQVRVYESMSSKVPGGPTHFISTSLTELNDIWLNKFLQFDVELTKVIEQMKSYDALEYRTILELRKNRKAWENLLMETENSFLAENISFTLRMPVYGNYEAEHNYYYNILPGSARDSMENLAQIEKILRILSGMFNQREGLEDQITDIIRPHGYAGSTRKELYEFCQLLDDNQNNKTGLSALVTEHKIIAEAIVGEIAINQNQLEMTVIYFDELTGWRNKLREEFDKRDALDEAYLRLRYDIMNDLKQLMKRVAALKSW